jgi:outer membrane protein OmpA-like peptidoglycan-associated protein
MIEGHTDSVGADDYNLQLSERRAAAVQTALLERGVSSNQITALGKGETFPVASNDNAGGRQQNRRVEMVFTDNASQVASDTQ